MATFLKRFAACFAILGLFAVLTAAYQPSGDFYLKVEQDQVPGTRIVRKFGAEASVGTSWTVVSSVGGYETPTTAQALEIVSSSANDTDGGSGAQTVTVEGLGSDWRFQTETVTLNGTAAVDLSNTWLRVFRMYVASSGTYATDSGPSHVSAITLRADGGGASWAAIESVSSFGLGQTEIAVYSVPLGEDAFIDDVYITTESNQPVDVGFFSRCDADDTSTPYAPMRVRNVYRSLAQGAYPDNSRAAIGPLVGPCDIGFLAKTDSGNSDVAVWFTIVLVENGE